MDPKLPFYSKYCKCPACGRYFTTPDTFDMHRVWGEDGKTRLCRDPSRLVFKSGSREGQPRLVLNDKGYWGYPPRENAVSESGTASGDEL